jgi:hypothetical protein
MKDLFPFVWFLGILIVDALHEPTTWLMIGITLMAQICYRRWYGPLLVALIFSAAKFAINYADWKTIGGDTMVARAGTLIMLRNLAIVYASAVVAFVVTCGGIRWRRTRSRPSS